MHTSALLLLALCSLTTQAAQLPFAILPGGSMAYKQVEDRKSVV